jgi:sugar diacid utilization regulator
MEEPYAAGTTPLDMFTFANHLAWKVGGPITIEDPNWSILAYSTLHQHIDDARRHTILRHEVPPEFQELVAGLRVAERFIEGEPYVEVPADPTIDFHRRLAVPVRIGDVVVGSIWVADSYGQLSEDAVPLLLDAARQATHFFQLQSDYRRRESELLLRKILFDGNDADFLEQYFGLTSSAAFCVMRAAGQLTEDHRQQAMRLATVACRQANYNYMLLHEKGDIYLLLFTEAPQSPLGELALKLGYSLASVAEDLTVATGRPVQRVSDVHHSRHEADLVTRYLRSTEEFRIASYEHVRHGIALMEITEAVRSQCPQLPALLAPLSKLSPSDAADALTTLYIFFQTRGNAAEGARLQSIHPNTYRYRLNRVLDLLALDLDDQATRLLLELELMMVRFAPPSS